MPEKPLPIQNGADPINDAPFPEPERNQAKPNDTADEPDGRSETADDHDLPIWTSWILKTMAERFGDEAYKAFTEANGVKCRAVWARKARETGDDSIGSLIKHLWGEPKGDGLDFTVEITGAGYQMKCTKCPTYEYAKRHGITEQMYYIICEGDPYFAEGFNPDIGFKRTKTLMQGHDCCDHFYFYKSGRTDETPRA